MKLILGHNQFIGISHISEEKSIQRERRFSDVRNIYTIVEKAVEHGFSGMIIETHPRMIEFVKYYQEKGQTFDIGFYLQVPFAQGYIKKLNENGFSGLVKEIISRGGLKYSAYAAIKNILNLAKKNYLSIATTALQLETAPFRDVAIETVLLHNVITDLLLSLGMNEAFEEYMRFVSEKLRLEVGFVTLNFPMFTRCVAGFKGRVPVAMTPINPRGYDMHPSRNAVEKALRGYRGPIMAMNVLGGGAFGVENAVRYLKTIDNLTHCVIGCSSETHIKDFVEKMSGDTV